MATHHPQARHKARKLALQALYQWVLSGNTIQEVEAQFRTHQDLEKTDLNYFHSLIHGVCSQVTAIDAEFNPLLDRDSARLDPIELNIIRIATFELMTQQDVPYRVVINEALELAKQFGATDGHKYVNGVLDKLSRQLRSQEFIIK